ncbi:hypothetical protein EVAR_63450_1 [Eumeta japonica]|uniref:Uncharacterized protein n=1 Tax=Eumeta variegata TaxID=151549 RepID=A0A4C1ZYZ9_EUMVA|nr:hypothetical protein EVAR_63450_1 [Eumeta japonica]
MRYLFVVSGTTTTARTHLGTSTVTTPRTPDAPTHRPDRISQNHSFLPRYPILSQKAGNVLVTALRLLVSMGGGDHFGGSHARLPLDLLQKMSLAIILLKKKENGIRAYPTPEYYFKLMCSDLKPFTLVVVHVQLTNAVRCADVVQGRWIDLLSEP